MTWTEKVKASDTSWMYLPFEQSMPVWVEQVKKDRKARKEVAQ